MRKKRIPAKENLHWPDSEKYYIKLPAKDGGRREKMLEWHQKVAIGRVAMQLARKFKLEIYRTVCGVVDVYSGPVHFASGPMKGNATRFFEIAGGYIPIIRFLPRTNRARRRLFGALPEINSRLARVSRACGANVPVGVSILPPRY